MSTLTSPFPTFIAEITERMWLFTTERGEVFANLSLNLGLEPPMRFPWYSREPLVITRWSPSSSSIKVTRKITTIELKLRRLYCYLHVSLYCLLLNRLLRSAHCFFNNLINFQPSKPLHRSIVSHYHGELRLWIWTSSPSFLEREAGMVGIQIGFFSHHQIRQSLSLTITHK